MRLEKEVAIVTGSTRGLGRRIARRFAEEGAKTVVTGRRVALGERVAKEITDKGGEAIFIPCDLTDESQVRNLVDGTIDRYGALTVLINNAAPTELSVSSGRIDGAAWEISSENWDTLMRQFITANFFTIKYSVPHMMQAVYGSIVNFSSIDARITLPDMAGYATGKAAIHGLTRAVAHDGAGHNIRCNCIMVGIVPTPDDDFDGEATYIDEINRSRRMMRDPKTLPFAHAVQNVVMGGKIGEAENIAALATFLASREAQFITATIIPCDGGTTAKLAWPDTNAVLEEQVAQRS